MSTAVDPSEAISGSDSARLRLAAQHLRSGWWLLLTFLLLGLGLDALHGFKVGFYLDVSNETRRLLWTLAHAHGVLLSIVHLVFAACLRSFPLPAAALVTASRCLTAASLLLPGGFFLGGLVIYGGDPNPGVALVPIGALLLAYAVLAIARQASALR
jgi:hypothetical protein